MVDGAAGSKAERPMGAQITSHRAIACKPVVLASRYASKRGMLVLAAAIDVIIDFQVLAGQSVFHKTHTAGLAAMIFHEPLVLC